MTFETSNNTLLTRLLLALPDAAICLKRVPLKPGPWALQGAEEDDFIYFPEEGLVSLWRPGPQESETMLAMVGRHSCLLPGYWRSSAFRAHVWVAGHAQRLDGAMLKSDAHRHALCLLETAKASQQLIRQMAQMAFCVQHHTVAQRLASWLLICLDQSPLDSVQIPLSELERWLGATPAQLQDALETLQAHSAIGLEALPSFGVVNGLGAMPKVLHTQAPTRLVQLACSCHLQVREGGSAPVHDGD